jgi:hypothetical protein
LVATPRLYGPSRRGRVAFLPQASEVRLHFLLPLVGAVAGLLGVALCSALMLVGSGSVSAPRRLTR